MTTIMHDALAFPHLFLWNGRPDGSALRGWVESHSLWTASELVTLLAETGGGILFETEVILAPFLGGLADHADAVNRVHRHRGLPDDLWLFHTGITLSAYSRTRRTYDELSPSYRTTHSYASLDDWYVMVLRSEYAERYEMTKP